MTPDDMPATATRVNYSVATSLLVDNAALHDWASAGGDIGLAYSSCSSQPCPFTAFQTILTNTVGDISNPFYPSSFNGSNSLLFGLDFHSNSSGTPSTMQLGNEQSSISARPSVSTYEDFYICCVGFVNETYANSIMWTSQPLQYPIYHELLLYNLEICGVQVFGKFFIL